ncbi:MAG: DegT/DnrJ/EryC1/StrS family aminotransferase [Planctomycetes bacterium]|nr:DegT/DnrJ/EryC1/StrS family aminotransferase [Planctomycetota bacterium]
MKRVRMLELRREYELFADEVRAAIDGVLEDQQFIGGPAVLRFEKALCARFDIAHAVAVSSGTDALLCALMAIGTEPGDEVIVPALTFFATGGVVSRLGARPVFVDIDPSTFNLNPSGIEAAVTSRTKAIIPVHLFGQCAEMDAINAVAKRHGLAVIEDAAQAIDAHYRGRYAGTLGRASCLSFYPTKNLGGFGEGGMILTNDEDLARIARQLRNQGQSRGYIHDRVGGNFRLDTLKAAILLAKLPHFDHFTKRRRHNAALYDELLSDAPVTTPYAAEHQQPVYHQYSILSDRRDDLAAFLRDRGVDTAVYYPVPLHLQPCFASLGYERGALPVAERICDQVLSLPCHPMLTDDELQYVASSIRAFHTADAGRATPSAVQELQ